MYVSKQRGYNQLSVRAHVGDDRVRLFTDGENLSESGSVSRLRCNELVYSTRVCSNLLHYT